MTGILLNFLGRIANVAIILLNSFTVLTLLSSLNKILNKERIAPGCLIVYVKPNSVSIKRLIIYMIIYYIFYVYSFFLTCYVY